jgi:phage shock protein PspC (stress-responsive transcriptional regulator)
VKKSCPFCAEDIEAQAVRCPYCRSRLTTFVVEGWHRDHSGRIVAGVAAALAQALGVPVALARAGFVVLAPLHLLGFLAYGVLWLLIPERAGEASILENALARAQRFAQQMSGRRAGAGGTEAGYREAEHRGAGSGDPQDPRAGSDSPRIALNESGGQR